MKKLILIIIGTFLLVNCASRVPFPSVKEKYDDSTNVITLKLSDIQVKAGKYPVILNISIANAGTKIMPPKNLIFEINCFSKQWQFLNETETYVSINDETYSWGSPRIHRFSETTGKILERFYYVVPLDFVKRKFKKTNNVSIQIHDQLYYIDYNELYIINDFCNYVSKYKS